MHRRKKKRGRKAQCQQAKLISALASEGRDKSEFLGKSSNKTGVTFNPTKFVNRFYRKNRISSPKSEYFALYSHKTSVSGGVDK